jgi:hypothetical protein
MKREWLPTTLLAVSIVTAASIVAYTIMSSMSKREQISVTGLAQVDFLSDVIVWQGTFERKAMELNQAYSMIRNDADAVRGYLAQKGVNTKEVVIGAVEIKMATTEVPVGDNLVSKFDGYLLTQTVKIESRNVDHIEMVSREISELLNTGLALQSEVPKYYYSKLKDLKIDLLKQASADGMERAKAIAVNSGGSLGKLYQANMGTFQITAPNSDEEYTWGGAFNTTSRKKTASITVQMDFLTR